MIRHIIIAALCIAIPLRIATYFCDDAQGRVGSFCEEIGDATRQSLQQAQMTVGQRADVLKRGLARCVHTGLEKLDAVLEESPADSGQSGL